MDAGGGSDGRRGSMADACTSQARGRHPSDDRCWVCAGRAAPELQDVRRAGAP